MLRQPWLSVYNRQKDGVHLCRSPPPGKTHSSPALTHLKHGLCLSHLILRLRHLSQLQNPVPVNLAAVDKKEAGSSLSYETLLISPVGISEPEWLLLLLLLLLSTEGGGMFRASMPAQRASRSVSRVEG